MAMKFSLKNYWKETPRFMRAIGDACLWFSSAVATYGVFVDDKQLSLVALSAGLFGKFITNLFHDDKGTS